MKKLKFTFLATSLLISFSSMAGDNIIATALLNTSDKGQSDCIKQLTNLPYATAIKNAQGNYNVRFSQRENNLIYLQVYAEPTKEALSINPNLPLKSFVDQGTFIVSKSSDFALVDYQGVVRNHSFLHLFDGGYDIMDEFQYSRNDSLNPPADDILSIKKTTLVVASDKIFLYEHASYKASDVGVSIPTSLLSVVMPIRCVFNKDQ